MTIDAATKDATAAQLLAIIATQTEIARLGLDLGSVMALIAERAQTITEASGAVVELVEGDDMVYRAVAGDAAGMLGVRLTREASLSGLCVESEETLRCDDSDVDPRVDREACRRVGLRSIVVVPLIHEGDAVGALTVFSPEVAAFDDGDARVLALMSELIAAAMFHATRFGVDELFRQATTDQLTGLANRALFMDRLRHAIASSFRTQRRLAVLMLDMEGLKPINDTFGHRAGDAAIAEMARRIASELRQSDTVARIGGDEFAYLLSTVPDREGAFTVAQRIARRCDRPFEFEGQTFQIGASIGVAIGPDDGDEPDVLLALADRDMYAAKRRKKTSASALRPSPSPLR
jgi:diguanylate cyclase (GGDEF)-like protein